MEFIISFFVILFRIIKYSILIRVLMSWVPGDPGSPIRRFFYEVTEPVLAPVRKIMPRMGMIDLSPIIAFFLLDFLQMGIMSLLQI